MGVFSPPSLGELRGLLEEAESAFERERSLVKLGARRAVFVGDIHGDYLSVEYVLKRFLGEYSLVFLGDYVDRGPEQLRCIVTLLRLKAEEPGRVVMLRGNHETARVNSSYGFFAELVKWYGGRAQEAFTDFNRVFSKMPYACLIGRVLAVHGGIARELRTLRDIEAIPKGDLEAEEGLAAELLWNDPSEDVEGFAPNAVRGGGYVFGRKPLEEFMRRNRISLVVRSHYPYPEGFRYMFPTGGQEKPGGRLASLIRRAFRAGPRYPGLLLSIFTCRYYRQVKTPSVAVFEKGRISQHVVG
ncbi:metallophosphoesterase [Infirmifilum lucidum]|uniref:Metallophosphoesterase n=1 Tax=Infirmifilum lucidum TaxID=2776706 RepID=A0A7L9FJK8_9CREN|nr:metallophosphoesterase [Infirmifilum lucidum]QOJ78975.1 metallophosphoesterase [Infirmifilum lucidum]